jgi:protein TonB
MSSTSLDEIVFENRNKEYGAYLLRATYVRTVLIGVSFSFIITFGFCMYFFYDNFLVADDYSFSPEMLKYAQYNIDEELLKQTQLDPIKEKIKVIPQPKVSLKEVTKVSSGNANAALQKEVVKVVDSVAIKDSIQKKIKEEVEAEIEKTKIDSLPKFGESTDAFRNYLVSVIQYPDTSLIRKMKGKLLITFIVTTNGQADNVILDNFADTKWGKSIIFAIKASPHWQPAYRKGKPVKMQYSIPVYFAL